ncbi:MAG: hypothetical protein ACO3P5_06365, partial [Steroidobacteraceae bacterium]
MKQYGDFESLDDASSSKEPDPVIELLGNGLPMLPPMPSNESSDSSPSGLMMTALPVMLPPAIEAEADTRLEEFAVGLGIDRELARLLLRETSPQSSIRYAAPSDAVSRVAIAPDSAKITGDIAVNPITALPIVPDAQVPLAGAHTMGVSDEVLPVATVASKIAVTTHVDHPHPVSTLPVDYLSEQSSIPLAVTTSPLAPKPPLTEGSIQLPAVVETPPMVDVQVTDRSVIPPTTNGSPNVISAVSTASVSVIPGAPTALNDEDVLRWRAFVHRSSSGVREPAHEVVVAAQAAVDDVADSLSGAPRRGLSEADFAAATASLRGFALERRQILTTTATAVSSTILNGDSPVDP